MPHGRKTIGVLLDYIDHFSGGYEHELRLGFESACIELGLNLVLVAGRALEEPDGRSRVHNGIYDCVTPDWADGLILVSAGLGAYRGAAALEEFAERFRPLPMSSLGVALPGIPSVVADNRAGMEALVEHVVGHHGARRVAFLGGPVANPDAQSRFQAFRDVLARYGRVLDPDLVKTSDFTFDAGVRLTKELIDHGQRFDAIIGANDGLGLGASEALRARGLRIPSNVIVTGYDNLLMSRLGDPPLSTVRQPLGAMARRAVELLLAQLEGRPVPLQTGMSAEFIARESCGCGYQRRRDSNAPPRAASTGGLGRASLTDLLSKFTPAREGRDAARRQRAEQLIAALEAELDGTRGAFIARLDSILDHSENDNEVYEELQSVITMLKYELRSTDTMDLDGLWDRARRRISLSNTRSQVRQRTQLEMIYERLIMTGEQFSAALDLNTLRTSLAEELPTAGIRNALVSLFADEQRTILSPFLFLRDGEVRSLPAAASADLSLLPAEMFPEEERRTWLALPLTSEEHMLGVVVFGKDSHVTAYEMLRGQISSALNTVAMHREIVRQTAIHERTIQERAATAERMKSLSVLAGGVAHDLNNALGPLVALPDIILQEIEELARHRVPVDSEVYSDLKTIKSAALRAAQTIKDLLSLARVGRVNKEHLDLNQVIASCLSAPAHRPLVGQQRDVRLIYEQSPEALFVEASEPHVVRAAMNLVHNAVESIEGFGTVTIRTYRQRLNEALSGYETIEPGDYAVVTVSDTGHGMTPDVMQRVFEPFFSNKKAHENSGSGLGLAIVHGVIKEHHGFVNVESEPGRGTSFSLYFPLVERPASTERHSPPSVKPGNARILVVDDDPVQLRTARRILTRLGYDVTTTDSGSKAYALFEDRSSPRAAGSGAERTSPFDLVVMDMILQEADDGLRVLERIQALYPQQCAILVSGHAPMERGMLAVQRGIGWLGKPYTLEALGLAVQSALSPKQTAPSARSERSTPSLLVPRARRWKLSRAR